MYKSIFVATYILFGTMLGVAQSPDEKQVRDILNQQIVSWNKGDLDDFMKGYWQSDSLMFIGKSGVTYGYQQTLANYKKNYPDTASMGKLNFELLEVKKLPGMYYFVVGKWHLTRSIGNLKGAFTLIVRKINDKWVIVSDHSS